MNPIKRLIPPFLILLVIAIVGMAGYMQIEGWSLFDSVYMLVITLFTVGFQEVHPLSPFGRMLTMVIIISGVSTALYGVGQIGEMIIEGQLFGYGRKKRMERKIRDMKDHYIICGFGRVGHKVFEELLAEKAPCVIVDVKPETAQELEEKGVPYLVGNATHNGILTEAGIKKAKALISCADSDAENVYVTLSARAANPGIYIIARASGKDSEEKLKMAGANRVLSPYHIAGRRMAALVTRPIASDFLDMMMHGEHLDFGLREVLIGERSQLLGKSLSDSQIKQKSGATVLAIRKADGGYNLQPLATSLIEKGDILIVIGTVEQLEILEKMIK